MPSTEIFDSDHSCLKRISFHLSGASQISPQLLLALDCRGLPVKLRSRASTAIAGLRCCTAAEEPRNRMRFCLCLTRCMCVRMCVGCCIDSLMSEPESASKRLTILEELLEHDWSRFSSESVVLHPEGLRPTARPEGRPRQGPGSSSSWCAASAVKRLSRENLNKLKAEARATGSLSAVAEVTVTSLVTVRVTVMHGHGTVTLIGGARRSSQIPPQHCRSGPGRVLGPRLMAAERQPCGPGHHDYSVNFDL